nr:GGDEF domain [uncultured organism]
MGSNVWRWYVAASVFTAVAFLVIPAEPVQAFVANSLHLVASATIVVGTRRLRPAVTWPWYLLAGSVALFGIGDIAFWVQTVWLERQAFPSVSDYCYLPSTLLIVAALAGFTLARRTVWDKAGLLDAAVLSTGAGLITWLYVISPTAQDGQLSLLARVVSLSYPILDLLALAVLVRLTIGTGKRPFAYRLLVAGVTSLLVTDMIYTLQEVGGSYMIGGGLDLGWMAAHVLFAAAALHPSMPAVSQPTPPAPEGVIGRARLYALFTASMTAPLVLIIEWIRGDEIDAPVIAIGSIGLFLLVLLRLQGVVAQLGHLLDTAQSQAHTDLLTGLANRRLFYAQWELNLRSPSDNTALLYLDLDGFKPINDELGHQGGDAVLQAVADRISQVVRAGDVVARLGGDEFAVILPGASDEDAEEIAARILAAVAEPIRVRGAPVRVGASIGVIMAPHGADPDSEIQRADAAMYAAKAAGRGRIGHA